MFIQHPRQCPVRVFKAFEQTTSSRFEASGLVSVAPAGFAWAVTDGPASEFIIEQISRPTIALARSGRNSLCVGLAKTCP
jgi:hypothetical protein